MIDAPGIRAIFFDLDDTLCDEGRCYREALQASCRFVQHCLGLEDWIPVYHAYLKVSDRLWEAFQQWGPGLGHAAVRAHVWKAALEAAGLRCDDTFVDAVANHYAAERSSRHGWLPGVEEAFRSLCGRYALGIITNGATEIQKEKIDRLELTQHCVSVLVGEECGCQKPDRRIFDRALREAGVSARESLMVGDRPGTDILGAHTVGMRAAWIAEPEAPWPLSGPEPWLRCRSVADLPAILSPVDASDA